MKVYMEYSSEVREIIVEAQREACGLGEEYISTEHLLAAIARFAHTAGAQLLLNEGIEPGEVRSLLALSPCGSPKPRSDLRLTPRAERILNLSADVSLSAGCDAVGSHHLLAALLLEGEGLAAIVLKRAGLDGETLKIKVMQMPCG